MKKSIHTFMDVYLCFVLGMMMWLLEGGEYVKVCFIVNFLCAWICMTLVGGWGGDEEATTNGKNFRLSLLAEFLPLLPVASHNPYFHIF